MQKKGFFSVKLDAKACLSWEIFREKRSENQVVKEQGILLSIYPLCKSTSQSSTLIFYDTAYDKSTKNTIARSPL